MMSPILKIHVAPSQELQPSSQPARRDYGSAVGCISAKSRPCMGQDGTPAWVLLQGSHLWGCEPAMPQRLAAPSQGWARAGEGTGAPALTRIRRQPPPRCCAPPPAHPAAHTLSELLRLDALGPVAPILHPYEMASSSRSEGRPVTKECSQGAHWDAGCHPGHLRWRTPLHLQAFGRQLQQLSCDKGHVGEGWPTLAAARAAGRAS